MHFQIKSEKEAEERILNLQQFYEFYERFQHFCVIYGSQKIDMKQTREFVMSRLSQEQMEESKAGDRAKSIEQRPSLPKKRAIMNQLISRWCLIKKKID